MKELTIHLRKDVRLLMTDPMFIILLVALAGIAFIIALMSCSGYVSSMVYGGDVVTKAFLELEQRRALANYWGSIGSMLMAIFTVTAALAMTGEKESGMLRYVLTYRTSKLWFYLSKFLVLLSVVLMALLISLACYLVVFSFMDVPMLDLGVLAESMVFPLLIAIVFATIGLTLSALSDKKVGAIVVSVGIFFLLTTLSQVSIGLGTMAAYEINPAVTSQNVTEFIPLEYKLLIYANPLVLGYGTNLILDVPGHDHFTDPHLFEPGWGVALGLSMALAWFGMGMLAFSRVRMGRGWLARLKDRLRDSRPSRPWPAAAGS